MHTTRLLYRQNYSEAKYGLNFPALAIVSAYKLIGIF